MNNDTTQTTEKLLAFAVGNEGEFDWQVVHATDELSAKLSWIEDYGNEDSDTPSSIIAERRPDWDGKIVTTRMWFKHYGAYCHDCGYETFRQNGGIIDREGNVVCEDCQHDRKIKKSLEKKNAKAA